MIFGIFVMSFPFRSLLFAQHFFDDRRPFLFIQKDDEVEADRKDARQDTGKDQHHPAVDDQEVPDQQREDRSHDDRQGVLQDGWIEGCPFDVKAMRPVNRQEEQGSDHCKGCARPSNDIQFQCVIGCELQRHQDNADRNDRVGEHVDGSLFDLICGCKEVPQPFQRQDEHKLDAGQNRQHVQEMRILGRHP